MEGAGEHRACASVFRASSSKPAAVAASSWAMTAFNTSSESKKAPRWALEAQRPHTKTRLREGMCARELNPRVCECVCTPWEMRWEHGKGDCAESVGPR